MFLRKSSIQDQLVQSHYNRSGRHFKCKYPGTYRCGGCSYCQYIWPRQTHVLPNGETHQVKHFINCQTMGICLMTCICGSYYVGKTKRHFWQGMYDHVSAIGGEGVTLHRPSKGMVHGNIIKIHTTLHFLPLIGYIPTHKEETGIASSCKGRHNGFIN